MKKVGYLAAKLFLVLLFRKTFFIDCLLMVDSILNCFNSKFNSTCYIFLSKASNFLINF